MDVLVVSAEIAPYSRSTSAAEMTAALPKALRGLGHKVTVLSPLWASIDPATRHLARRLVKIEVDVDGSRRALPLFEGRSAGGVDLQFLADTTTEGEALFPRNASPADTGPETARRWGAFARAVVELLARRDTLPDVVHVVSWQTAALPVLMREHPRLSSVPTVLTIHDPAEQGLFDRKELATFGIPESWWRIDGVEFYGKLSTLKAGVQTASRITTPSPTHAQGGLGTAGRLEGALKARGKHVVGILEGVDVSVWNAATDPWLESRFDAMDVAGSGKFGKQRCRSALQKEMGFATDGALPLIAAIGAVVPGSGFDALSSIAVALLRNELQMVIAAEPGSDPELVARFVDLASRWPDRLAVRADADTGMIHRLLGASDLALVPWSADATGARAMQAHRYGSLPIALRAAGVADAVVDCDARLTSGTGFLFDEPTGPAMLAAIQRALAATKQRDALRAVAHRAMMVDHGWERSARLYERVYRAAIPARSGEAASAAPAV
jgi:starch synthase